MLLKRFFCMFVLALILQGCSSIDAKTSTLPVPTQSIAMTIAVSTLTPTVPPSTPTATPDPFVISRENIDQLVFLTRFGDEWISSLSWSPDGKQMVVTSPERLEIYDMQTYARVRRVNVDEALNECQDCLRSGVNMAVYNPIGGQIAVSHDESGKNVLIMDPDTGKFIQWFPFSPAKMRTLAYSPDGKLLAGCVARDSDTIYVWNAQTGKIVHQLHEDALLASSVVFSPDGSKILSGSLDGSVRLWDSNSGELLKTVLIDDNILDVAFSPDGKYFATVGDLQGEHTYIWDASGKLVHIIKEDSYGGKQKVVFSPKSDLVITGDYLGVVRVYDLASGQLLKALERTGSISGIAFSPNGRILAIGSSQDGNVRLWALSPLAEQMPTPTPQPDLKIASIYSSLPPGEYIVYKTAEHGDFGMGVVSMDGKIQSQFADEVYGHALSADGRLVDLDSDVNAILNLQSGVITKFPGGGSISPNQAWTVRFDCDGARGLEITRISNNQKICISYDDDVSYPVWSPDGHWLAYYQFIMDATQQNSTLHEPKTGLYLIDTACFSEPASCSKKTKGPFYHADLTNLTILKWSPDSQYILCGVGGQTGQILFNLKSEQYWKINQNGANDFAMSPDNQWVAYQGTDHQITLRNLSTGVEKQIQATHSVGVLFWLTAPLLKTRQSFAITAAGDSLNVRANPSFSAVSLEKLRTHDVITVLDGPVQVEGYAWWHIRSGKDGVEGWTVEYYGWYQQQ